MSEFYLLVKIYILAFIPVFVAVNAVSVLPIFVGLTADLKPKKRNEVLSRSILTATLIAMAFIFVGKIVFNVLGVTVADFKIDKTVPGTDKTVPKRCQAPHFNRLI